MKKTIFAKHTILHLFPWKILISSWNLLPRNSLSNFITSYDYTWWANFEKHKIHKSFFQKFRNISIESYKNGSHHKISVALLFFLWLLIIFFLFSVFQKAKYRLIPLHFAAALLVMGVIFLELILGVQPTFFRHKLWSQFFFAGFCSILCALPILDKFPPDLIWASS